MRHRSQAFHLLPLAFCLLLLTACGPTRLRPARVECTDTAGLLVWSYDVESAELDSSGRLTAITLGGQTAPFTAPAELTCTAR